MANKPSGAGYWSVSPYVNSGSLRQISEEAPDSSIARKNALDPSGLEELGPTVKCLRADMERKAVMNALENWGKNDGKRAGRRQSCAAGTTFRGSAHADRSRSGNPSSITGGAGEAPPPDLSHSGPTREPNAGAD
ncbi:hypothetical protein C8R44DRAFT_733076 [Mycena epipterygia]|nr:hypothetical protein C8R44DRAFT_733076 [Mycena epipterygia]